MSDVVIVGAGECGARAAFALREAGHDGKVTLIGEERHWPYERPPLSKPAENGAVAVRSIASPERYVDARIDLRRNVGVALIDRVAREVELTDGARVGYDRLLLATGSLPRRLSPNDGALVLRTADDAEAIAARLAPGARVVVIGAGLIGLELSATFRAGGVAVTVVEAASRALGRAIPPVIAERLVARHREAAVEILFDARIKAVAGDGIALADGTQIAADMVVVAIGVAPNTRLAEAAGLAVENGIAVDATLATSDPAVFAAGDCASFPYQAAGRRVRVESWRNAQDQGAHAARAMLGALEPFRRVPWFWSDQYELGLQVAGLYDPAAPLVARETGNGALLMFQCGADGRLAMAAGIGPGNAVAKDVRIAERLIEQGAEVSAEALADPSVGLKSLLVRG
jgi:3-phenylpropionate/trans-cinnamate dioxygenase ferredoxin reductase subunit